MPETPVQRCRRYRRRILEISRQVPAAHVAPAFSCVEIVDALYNGVMRSQDIFIMSKGHGWLAQLVVLEDRGHVTREMVDAYGQVGKNFGGHPDYWPQVGIHASTGSLGHGLGIAAGQALAERLKGSGVQIYVLLSDGECQEGSTWEAAMVAANLNLTNLTVLVDANNFGGMDRMSETHPEAALFPLAKKFEAFGWEENGIDGHDSYLLLNALRLNTLRSEIGLNPRAIVCRTVKGRGVSFMENAPIWHYRSPNDEEYDQAMRELSAT